MAGKYVDVDPEPTKQDPIWSREAIEILNFLEDCGGATEEAIKSAFPKSFNLLYVLRKAGWVRRCFVPALDALWISLTTEPPTTEYEFIKQSAVGWFAARLKAAGGSVRNTDKGLIAIFPSKAEFPLVVWDARGGKAPLNSFALIIDNSDPPSTAVFWVYARDLITKPFKDCIQTAKK